MTREDLINFFKTHPQLNPHSLAKEAEIPFRTLYNIVETRPGKPFTKIINLRIKKAILPVMRKYGFKY